MILSKLENGVIYTVSGKVKIIELSEWSKAQTEIGSSEMFMLNKTRRGYEYIKQAGDC